MPEHLNMHIQKLFYCSPKLSTFDIPFNLNLNFEWLRRLASFSIFHEYPPQTPDACWHHRDQSSVEKAMHSGKKNSRDLSMKMLPPL